MCGNKLFSAGNRKCSVCLQNTPRLGYYSLILSGGPMSSHGTLPYHTACSFPCTITVHVTLGRTKYSSKEPTTKRLCSKTRKLENQACSCVLIVKPTLTDTSVASFSYGRNPQTGRRDSAAIILFSSPFCCLPMLPACAGSASCLPC